VPCCYVVCDGLSCYRYLCGSPMFMLKGILHWVIRKTLLQVIHIISMIFYFSFYFYAIGSSVLPTLGPEGHILEQSAYTCVTADKSLPLSRESISL